MEVVKVTSEAVDNLKEVLQAQKIDTKSLRIIARAG
jgi:Fe-S cluster assembly iron-binding protein IscA